MEELVLGPEDFHLVYSSDTGMAKLWDSQGRLRDQMRMGDEAVGGPGFGHEGRCPRGTYVLGRSEPRDEIAEGYWFTPVLDRVPGGPMAEYEREGIGIHGGGTGLEWPFEAEQPIERTRGCLRVHNQDNAYLAGLNNEVRARKGLIYLTVEGE